MEQREIQAIPEPISQEVFIQASIDSVYDYLAQPERWHEWHPMSLSAETGIAGPLPAKHRFTEKINLLGVCFALYHRVQIANRSQELKTMFTCAALDGCMHFQLREVGSGTLLRHTLACQTDLPLSGLHARMLDSTKQAMSNLKQHLEQVPA